MFVVKHEIPTKKQGNKYFFDKDGDSFIAKGEKLHLVAAKKNVGMFKTEANEFVYLPVKQAAGNPAQKLHEIIKAAQDLLSVISKNPPAATTAPTAARKEALLSTQGPSHSGQYGGNFGVSQKAPAKAAPAKTTNIEGKLEEILSVINGLKAEFASTTQVAQPVR